MTQVNAISQAVKSLANKEPVKNHYSMDSETTTLLESFSKVLLEEKRASNSLIDDLYNKGYKPFHFVDMRETEDKQGAKFRDNVLSHIVKGWNDPKAEKLYYANPKTLKVSELAEQAFFQDQARITYNNMKGGLKRRIEKGDKVGRKPAAPKQVLAKKAVEQALKYLSEIKEGYAGMPEDIKTLKGLTLMKITK